MKKIMLCLFLVMVLCAFASAKNTTVLKVKSGSANVRAESSISSEVVGQVVKGAILEATGLEEGWYRISFVNKEGDTIQGYIHENVVSIISGETEAAEEEAAEEKDIEEAPKPRRKATVRPSRHSDSSSSEKDVEYRRAEARPAGGFKLQGGIAMANARFSESIPAGASKKSSVGPMGGIGFESAFSRNVLFEMDFMYTPGGCILNGTYQGYSGKITMSGAMVSAPLLLKIKFMPGSSPYLLGGGEVGYFLSNKVKWESGAQKGEIDVKDDMNKLYYGVMFGGGFELKSNSMSLLFELRYQLGLSNLIKDPTPGDYMKNNSIQILIGIKL